MDYPIDNWAWIFRPASARYPAKKQQQWQSTDVWNSSCIYVAEGQCPTFSTSKTWFYKLHVASKKSQVATPCLEYSFQVDMWKLEQGVFYKAYLEHVEYHEESVSGCFWAHHSPQVIREGWEKGGPGGNPCTHLRVLISLRVGSSRETGGKINN